MPEHILRFRAHAHTDLRGGLQPDHAHESKDSGFLKCKTAVAWPESGRFWEWALSTAAATTVSSTGWLRSREFHASFIFEVAALALTSGLPVLIPALFVPMLLLDPCLLGHHYVVATYTQVL